MTDPGGVLMGRPELERAFTALGDRLARRGVVADLFVVGGAVSIPSKRGGFLYEEAVKPRALSMNCS